jgi:hypothetical protein
LFRDAHTYTRKCRTSQLSIRKERKLYIPLQPVTISRNFDQWEIDVIGEINPNSSKQHKYILTTTNYFTRWSEAIPLTHVNEKVVMQFLEQHLITRFKVPLVLVFDNTAYFSSTLLMEFSLEKGWKNQLIRT